MSVDDQALPSTHRRSVIAHLIEVAGPATQHHSMDLELLVFALNGQIRESAGLKHLDMALKEKNFIDTHRRDMYD